MPPREKPKRIADAVKRNDKSILSPAGRKGGRNSADIRFIVKKEINEDAMLAELIHEHGEEEAMRIWNETVGDDTSRHSSDT